MFRFLALGAVLFQVNWAQAGAYPWVPVQPDDMRVFTTQRADLATRLLLIERARYSIDLVVFEQAFDDEVGKPVLSALRDAADRGVQVRLLTSRAPQLMYDHDNEAARYLTEAPTRVPVQYLVFGTLGNLKEQVHEKLLIIDDSIVLASGRGHAARYLTWIDTSFLIRGALATQAVSAMDQIWSDALSESALFKPKRRKAPPPAPRYLLPSSMSPRGAEVAELAGLDAWLDGPRLPWNEAPGRGRVLHFDFIRQFRARGYQAAERPLDRVEQFSDCVVDAVVDRLEAGAHELRLSTLSVILNPRLKGALIAAAAGGTQVTLLTNGEGTGVVPWDMAWHASLPDMVELLQYPGIQIRALDRRIPGNPWDYTHRKLAIIDDTVLFGSHNLNLPSSTYADELSFEIEGGGYADGLRALFDGDAEPSTVSYRREDLVSRMGTESDLRAFMGRSFFAFF